MNLFELENEDAVDMLADILEPACKIMANEEVQKAYRSKKPKLLIIKTMLKECKESVVELLAIINGKDPKEYKCTIPSIIKDLLSLLNDENVQVLFQSQSQNIIKTSSGSATENTEVEEQ